MQDAHDALTGNEGADYTGGSSVSRGGSLPSRVVRAACLDSSLYREVRHDRSATSQALLLVALVALAHGVGGIVRAFAFDWSPIEGILFGLQGELIFFFVTTLAIYLIGRFALGTTATYLEVMRPFGFSVVPGYLIVVASAASALWSGAEAMVLPVILVWRLAAGFVAVRQAMGLGKLSSAAILLAGVLLGLLAVAGGSTLLVLLVT